MAEKTEHSDPSDTEIYPLLLRSSLQQDQLSLKVL